VLVSNTPLWRSIWQLQIPRTVILFLWRACNEILPTKENLCRCHIMDDPLCPMCGMEGDSTVHAIWNCPTAQAVWNECPARIHKCTVMEGGFLALFGSLSFRLEKEEIKLLVMVAQRIWFCRNRKIFEGELVPPNCSVKCGVDALNDFKKANTQILPNT
jgi:hypothetical protein